MTFDWIVQVFKLSSDKINIRIENLRIDYFIFN